MSEGERLRDVQENSDLCETRAGRFFVRAVLPLPVEGWENPYNIGLWAEVSKENFYRILDLWTDPGQEAEPPFAAKIANEIYSHPLSLGLEAELRLTGPRTRPAIYVSGSEHEALHREQCLGITPHRAYEYTNRDRE
eukprot:TRINITY_DN7708_c0_g2_i2.p1 TRINITY_DN7708_c0_g2~~TRINITY_DN7708_c0_g2_i2.p1  ORF type:complete len:137 (+),score=13.75 TRINITY_DN7708_c0_g2_i2:138-548(+)